MRLEKTTVKKKKSMWRETARRTMKSPTAKAGVFLFAFIILVCVLAPVLSKYDPNEMDYAMISVGPCSEHWFGTDTLGRDIFARILYGGRISLFLGFSASIVGNGVGIILGCLAGYFGKGVETSIMRFLDVLSSLPDMLLCILISATLGTGTFNTILALAVSAIPNGTRMIRGQILGERGKEYLEAAESINCKKRVIMFNHLLPNVISPMIVVITMGIGSMITQAAALSFIGLGVQPPTAEWGAMLSAGRNYIRSFPHMIMLPGIAIALTVLAINLMGDGLRDALDPKLRK